MNRLVKNRRAAQLFRKRQKEHITDLEKQVHTLAAENASYGARVDLLTSENNLIRDQLGYLRTFIGKAVQLSFASSIGAQGLPFPLPSHLPPLPGSLLQQMNDHIPLPPQLNGSDPDHDDTAHIPPIITTTTTPNDIPTDAAPDTQHNLPPSSSASDHPPAQGDMTYQHPQ